jgi:hypothetical protein
MTIVAGNGIPLNRPALEKRWPDPVQAGVRKFTPTLNVSFTLPQPEDDPLIAP